MLARLATAKKETKDLNQNAPIITRPLLFLIPSAHAVDYVHCEAIRAVIARNSIQRQEAYKDANGSFKTKKVREKYGKDCYKFDYGTKDYKDCNAFQDKVWENFKEEGYAYRKSLLTPYNKIETRAQKDFKKKGCYWF